MDTPYPSGVHIYPARIQCIQPSPAPIQCILVGYGVCIQVSPARIRCIRAYPVRVRCIRAYAARIRSIQVRIGAGYICTPLGYGLSKRLPLGYSYEEREERQGERNDKGAGGRKKARKRESCGLVGSRACGGIRIFRTTSRALGLHRPATRTGRTSVHTRARQGGLCQRTRTRGQKYVVE